MFYYNEEGVKEAVHYAESVIKIQMSYWEREMFTPDDLKKFFLSKWRLLI